MFLASRPVLYLNGCPPPLWFYLVWEVWHHREEEEEKKKLDVVLARYVLTS